MVFTHDTEISLRAVAALVNTDPRHRSDGADLLATEEELDAFVDEWQYSGSRTHDTAELDAVRGLRPELRALWTAAEDEQVAGVNALLARERALPQLVRHDGWGWHLHATTADAPPAERIAVEAGRSTLWAEVFTPVDATSDGAAFATGRGYVVAEENGAKLLDLAAAAPRWPALAEHAARQLDGRHVVTHLDRVADEHAGGLCALLSVFASMLPDSDLDLRDGAWDVARLRAAESRTADRGSRRLTAVALDPAGVVVGFSDLRVDSRTSPLAAVGGTLVLPAQRGHGLGLALKLGTHTELRALVARGEAACTHVETQNATDNVSVSRLNERLGYREVERALDLQKVVAPSS